MKRHIILLLWVFLLVCSAKPVTKTKKDETNTPESPDIETVEYERYLREVVEALESDPEFRKKLDDAPEADIRNGKIAQELEYVNHHVRSRLHEIKRREVERLRSLANKKFELDNEIDRKHLKISDHLDHKNEHTFEVKDLEKLIYKTSQDLAEIDRKRQEDFKQYEMQKEFEKEMTMKELDEKQRKQFEEEQKAQREKQKKHEKVHHPGNKAQLEDVWEKMDHLEKKDFNPRTFFSLHDINDNKYWEAEEVEALFVKELDKVYRSGIPETDMRERAEEMERMREHFFQETDTNRDGLISFEEFMDQTRREEYNRDPEWQTIDKQPQFTHEEYLEFERNRLKEIEQMVSQGLLPAHPNMHQGNYPHNSNAAYQVGQQHPAVNQMHYQDPQQQHMQQQKQYKQQQQQYQQHQQQQYQQYQKQPIHTNQVYQQIPVQQHQQPLQQQYQPQPVGDSLPSQQKHQPIVNNNNLTPQQPAASNSANQQQVVANNISPQQQPAATNKIQQPINNAIPQQTINNVQQEKNIPQKH